MAWSDLKAAVAEIIKTNGVQSITGANHQQTVNTIIDNLGGNFTYKGIATPETVPGSPDGKLFYFASTPGVYANFKGLEVLDNEIAILKYDGTDWDKEKFDTLKTSSKSNEIDLDSEDYIATSKAVKTLNDKVDSVKAGGLDDGSIELSKASATFLSYIGSGGSVTNQADDEDLENATVESVDVVRLKTTRPYLPSSYSGLGHTIIRKNLVLTVNTLTQALMSDTDMVYEIRYDFDLDGATIVVPSNCVIKFAGGSFTNGTLECDDTLLIEPRLDVDLTGTILNDFVNTKWFINSDHLTNLQRAIDTGIDVTVHNIHWVLDDTVHITTAGQKIIGEANTYNNPMLTFTPASYTDFIGISIDIDNVTIEGLQLICSSINTTTVGVYARHENIQYASDNDCHIVGCKIQNFGKGVKVLGRGASVVDNYITGCYVGVYTDWEYDDSIEPAGSNKVIPYGYRAIRIENNRFHISQNSTDNPAISLNGGASVNLFGAIIRGNIADWRYSFLYVNVGLENCLIADNMVSLANEFFMKTTTDSFLKNTIICNNTFKGNYSTLSGGVNISRAIFIANTEVDGLSIISNVFTHIVGASYIIQFSSDSTYPLKNVKIMNNIFDDVSSTTVSPELRGIIANVWKSDGLIITGNSVQCVSPVFVNFITENRNSSGDKLELQNTVVRHNNLNGIANVVKIGAFTQVDFYDSFIQSMSYSDDVPIDNGIIATLDNLDLLGQRYIVTKDIDLGGGSVSLLAGVTLDFQGGKITNGTLTLNGTKVLPQGAVIADYITATIAGTYKTGQMLYDAGGYMKIWNGSAWVYPDGSTI